MIISDNARSLLYYSSPHCEMQLRRSSPPRKWFGPPVASQWTLAGLFSHVLFRGDRSGYLTCLPRCLSQKCLNVVPGSSQISPMMLSDRRLAVCFVVLIVQCMSATSERTISSERENVVNAARCSLRCLSLLQPRPVSK